jgi:hypothetical protein
MYERIGRQWHQRYQADYCGCKQAHRSTSPRSAQEVHGSVRYEWPRSAGCGILFGPIEQVDMVGRGLRQASPADCATTAGSIPGLASLGRFRAGLAFTTTCSRLDWMLLAVAEISKSHLALSQRSAAGTSAHRPGMGQAALRRCGVCVSRDATTPRARDDAGGLGRSRIGRRGGLVKQPPPRTDTAPETKRLASSAHIDSTCHAVAPVREAAAAHRPLKPAKLTVGLPVSPLCSRQLHTIAIARLHLLLLNTETAAAHLRLKQEETSVWPPGASSGKTSQATPNQTSLQRSSSSAPPTSP